eukprot:TRINITY_DN19359_c0_g1_i2.p3 TRINITY_DN19359_c0_g1~~TRINITY_DN19359_c0_g1_i2.p3  ORF type:complete len:101 (-),score=4.95 TRINITY_DN19359_c0_g1_i2:122-424(-)
MKGYIYNKDTMAIATKINNVVACNGTTIKGDSFAALGIGEYVVTDLEFNEGDILPAVVVDKRSEIAMLSAQQQVLVYNPCLLYTSPSPRDLSTSRMPSSA